jgi:hypothetical protein
MLDRLRQWRERNERIRLQMQANQGTHTCPPDAKPQPPAPVVGKLNKVFGR